MHKWFQCSQCYHCLEHGHTWHECTHFGRKEQSAQRPPTVTLAEPPPPLNEATGAPIHADVPNEAPTDLVVKVQSGFVAREKAQVDDEKALLGTQVDDEFVPPASRENVVFDACYGHP